MRIIHRADDVQLRNPVRVPPAPFLAHSPFIQRIEEIARAAKVTIETRRSNWKSTLATRTIREAVSIFLLTSHRSLAILLWVLHRRLHAGRQVRNSPGHATAPWPRGSSRPSNRACGYGIARRIEQISKKALQINQGTIYASLVRLIQKRWISGAWGTSDNNRKAKFYSITKAGRKQLHTEAQNWERISTVIGRVLRIAERG